MDWDLLEGLGLDDDVMERILKVLASEKPAPKFVAPTGVGGSAGQNAPANVVQAREMGARRAAARRSSGDVMKYFL